MGKFMGILSLLATALCLISGCTKSYKSNYYLADEKEGIIYTRHHYTLIEKAGDSLKVWHLNFDYNAGYYNWPNPEIVASRTGKFRTIEIYSIDESHIECTRWYEGYKGEFFRLKRQNSSKKPHWIINMVQALEIDKKFNGYIRANSKNARPSTAYVGNDYIPDPNCDKMNPQEFNRYYTNKIKADADSVIIALDKGQLPRP